MRATSRARIAASRRRVLERPRPGGTSDTRRVTDVSLHYTHGPQFGVVEITALAFFEAAEPVLQEIARRTRQFGDRRLLVNLLDVVGTLGVQEQEQLGMLAWKHLSHLEKLASLVPADKLTRLSENTARAQGMQLRVFTELAAAIEWLAE
jgi:hypothetical protein